MINFRNLTSAALVAALSATIVHPIASAEDEPKADTVKCTQAVNGMPIKPLEEMSEWEVSGIKFWTAPGEASALLHEFTQWFHDNIESINSETESDLGDDWSWAEAEPIDDPDSPCSNHGAGAAVDLNAERHPMHEWNTFTPEQMRKIRLKLLSYHGKIQWGGNWSDPRDEMHFEYAPDADWTDGSSWLLDPAVGSSLSSK